MMCGILSIMFIIFFVMFLFFFFFFQAEDGIRDLTVTGVQTCALPISIANQVLVSRWFCARRGRAMGFAYLGLGSGGVVAPRSEEHTSELQSQSNLVCRLLLEKKKKKKNR